MDAFMLVHLIDFIYHNCTDLGMYIKHSTYLELFIGMLCIEEKIKKIAFIFLCIAFMCMISEYMLARLSNIFASSISAVVFSIIKDGYFYPLTLNELSYTLYTIGCSLMYYVFTRYIMCIPLCLFRGQRPFNFTLGSLFLWSSLLFKLRDVQNKAILAWTHWNSLTRNEITHILLYIVLDVIMLYFMRYAI